MSYNKVNSNWGQCAIVKSGHLNSGTKGEGKFLIITDTERTKESKTKQVRYLCRFSVNYEY